MKIYANFECFKIDTIKSKSSKTKLNYLKNKKTTNTDMSKVTTKNEKNTRQIKMHFELYCNRPPCASKCAFGATLANPKAAMIKHNLQAGNSWNATEGTSKSDVTTSAGSTAR